MQKRGHGHSFFHYAVYKLAQAVAQGAREVSGAQVDLKRVPETLPQDVLEKMNAIQVCVVVSGPKWILWHLLGVL